MENNNSTIGKRQEKEKQSVIEALKEMPIIQVACKRAGISRATYYRWKIEDGDFAGKCDAAFREGVELVNDMSESQIIQLIKEKKLPAITLWLKNNNPRYGGKVAPHSFASATIDLSPEEERIFKKALALSEMPEQYKHGKRNFIKKSA